MTETEQRITLLEEQVAFLLKSRPGRQLKPIVVSEAHVCGVDPARDSTTCEDASLWRRSKGCKGDGCVEISSTYYREYRANKKKDDGEEAEATTD